MKSIFVLTLFILPSIIFGQVSGNVNYQRRTAPRDNEAKATIGDESLVISVKGLFNTASDGFVASFHLTQIGETASITDSLMTLRIQSFQNAIPKDLADTVTFVSDVISFVPKYNVHIINRMFSKTYHEVPDGFELKKNILVRYQKMETLDVLLKAAASAEIYDLVKVDYFIRDVKRHYQKLREESIILLKEKMKTWEALGFKLETYRKTVADDFGTLLPIDRYGNYQAVSRPAYDAVKVSTTNGKLRITETGQSTFYDAVSLDNYDLVINPVVDKPVIQLTYEVTMKFFIPKGQAEKENNFFLLTPTGQLQKLDQAFGNQ